MAASIRVLAICVFRNEGRILVGNGFDEVKNERFHRPLGGEVEFGELAADALRREIREELGVEITEPVQLGVLENVFTFEGRPGHEVVVVFDADFVDASLFDEPELTVHEGGWERSAEWLDLSEPPPRPLYPRGLSALLGVESRRSSVGERP